MTRDPEPDAETIDSLHLVRRAQEGDAEAYERFIARYYDRVRAIVEKRLGPELRRNLESDDILQDAMTQAVQCFERFELRSRAELLGWFAQLVENRIRASNKHLHAPKRDVSREIPLQQDVDESSSVNALQPESPATDPFDALAHKEQLDYIEQCLEELDPALRRVLLLRHEGEASWDKVARVLGKPSPDAARMFYAKAKIELLKKIERRGGGSASF